MKALLFLLLLVVPAFTQDKLGVVIGEKSKSIRRVVIPDADATLLVPGFYTGKGEALIILDRARGTHPTVLEAEVEKATGIKPASPRMIVLDENNTVVDVILVDPDIDDTSGKMLVRSKDASVGDRVDARGIVTEKANPWAQQRIPRGD